ncbi:MAG: metallophosphoesterase family protein [Chloroflexota bacterium]
MKPGRNLLPMGRRTALRCMFVAFVVLTLVAGTSSAVTDRPLSPLAGELFIRPRSDDFTFAVFGDFRPARRDRPYPAVFRRILREIGMIGPHFAVSTGDAVFGYGGSFQRFRNQIDQFMSVVGSLDIPVFSVVGNHDVTGHQEREHYVRDKLGGLFGSFDVGASHFIILNTEERGSEGKIAGGQLMWLEADLEANRDAGHIFVFMHRPMYPAMDLATVNAKPRWDVENREVLQGLFVRYRVRYVFAGDEHLFSDTTRDGVRYIISGGSGAPLHQSVPRGGFFHYLIVRVSGPNVIVDVLQPYGLDVRTVAGNDGFESRSEVEVTNLTPVGLEAKRIPLTVPLSTADHYRIGAVSIPPAGPRSEQPATISRIKDNGDGTATLGVETSLPGSSVVRITAEYDD